jgi:hypothetical protein
MLVCMIAEPSSSAHVALVTPPVRAMAKTLKVKPADKAKWREFCYFCDSKVKKDYDYCQTCAAAERCKVASLVCGMLRGCSLLYYTIRNLYYTMRYYIA